MEVKVFSDYKHVPPTCRVAILTIADKWMTYNQICDGLRSLPYNYGTVERRTRELVELGLLEAKTEIVEFDGKKKSFRKFKRKEI